MEGSMPQAPVRKPGSTLRPSSRSAFALIAVAAAILVVAIVAMTPNEPAAPRTSTVEDGGLEWDTVVVVPEGGDASSIEASLDLEDTAFPVADGSEDRFVMYQLAGGRFDTNDHVDDRAAERVLGFAKDDGILITPGGDGMRANSATQPRSGEYTLSLDGSIEYEGIPKGSWELRAYVVDRSGSWDGPVAVRTVQVD